MAEKTVKEQDKEEIPSEEIAQEEVSTDENVETTESVEAEAVKEDKPKKKGKIFGSKENKELEKLKAEFEEYKNMHLRTLAEYDNFRKRTTAEKTQIYNNAVSDTVNALLPVADNIERALAQQDASADDLKKGFEMIAGQFTQSFEKLSIVTVGEIGEKFNPEFHNAVSHIDSEDFEENTISAVFQKGYKIGDKLVRFAMVQVAN